MISGSYWSGDDWFDEMPNKRRKRGFSSASSTARSRRDRVESYEVEDTEGYICTVRRRVRFVPIHPNQIKSNQIKLIKGYGNREIDPNQPDYIKIPFPVPMTWALPIHPIQTKQIQTTTNM